MGNAMENSIVPVIMCGGAGTRLWPVSRESLPKQFVQLLGASSTFQQVLERVADRELFGKPIVITHSEFRFVVAEQIRACGVDAEIVLEPVRRDSGPAVAVAAELVRRRDANASALVLAADHIVTNTAEFQRSCREAVAASASHIVTFGVKPTAAATNYGYIRPGKKLNGAAVAAIEAFVEKPDAATAERYVAAGYLWNSGNFMFRPETMQSEIAQFEPAMARAASASIDGARRDLDFLRLPEIAFAQAPKKSIDYAVMEKTALGAVLPVAFGWSDIGSWDAVWDLHKRDEDGNTTKGPVELVDTQGSLVWSDGKLLTTVIGCEDIVVVSTSDAVLVVPREQAEQVKSLVDLLKTKNHRQAVEHLRSFRPWGYYQTVDLGERYQVKRIVVNPGGKLSLQKHYHRAEHWVVVKGTAEVNIGDEANIVHENESTYIPIGNVHRLANPGKIPLELVEVQVGSYLGEDDIVRLEDVYRRE
jgi:mannose-1-phosphate guanylyltransferase / mannose-6-phosphate isomerase